MTQKDLFTGPVEIGRDHHFDGETFEKVRDSFRLSTQLGRVTAALMTGRWYTLFELETLTGYGSAAISARLRDLRKKRFGSHTVLNRRRNGVPSGAVWEYRLIENPQHPIRLVTDKDEIGITKKH